MGVCQRPQAQHCSQEAPGIHSLLGEGLPGSGQARGLDGGRGEEEEQDQPPWLNQLTVISCKCISKKICRLVRALAPAWVPPGSWQCLRAGLPDLGTPHHTGLSREKREAWWASHLYS